MIAFQSIVPMKSLILDLVSSLLKSAKRLQKKKRIKREGEENLNLFVNQTDHYFGGNEQEKVKEKEKENEKEKEKEKEKEQQESVRKKEDRRNEGQMRGEGNDDTDIDTCGNRINNWDVQQIRGRNTVTSSYVFMNTDKNSDRRCDENSDDDRTVTRTAG